MSGHNANPTAGRPDQLKIIKVVIDLDMGLFAFTYAGGITERMQIRDHTELPTVSAFLTALTDEVARFGRPQRRLQQSAPGNAVAA
jgi:hypothetical protein